MDIFQVALSDYQSFPYFLGGQTDPGAACGGGDEAVRGGGAGGEPGGVAGRTHDAQEDHRARRKQGQGLQVLFELQQSLLC